VADRDFLIEYVSHLAIIAMHTSRIAEQWVLWTSEEFKFMIAGDSVSTGSSIMPQKKNPDPMELTRGKTARVYGSLVNLLTLCKGLPMVRCWPHHAAGVAPSAAQRSGADHGAWGVCARQAYNRDLQEDKEPLFDATETVLMVLQIVVEFANNVTFDNERLKESLPYGHLDATTMADYLVHKGMPFRSGHEVVGKAVAMAEKKKCRLEDLSLDELKSINAIFDDEVYGYLGYLNSVRRFTSYGSTGGDRVAEQMALWKKRLAPREVGDATAVGGDIGAYAGATTAADPIEELCAEDPAADECRVYED